MMFDAKPALLWLIGIGIVISFALWAFRIIPWWGILVGGAAMPFVAVAAFFVIGIMAWMARGSH